MEFPDVEEFEIFFPIINGYVEDQEIVLQRLEEIFKRE
jgi:hypothetical protein